MHCIDILVDQMVFDCSNNGYKQLFFSILKVKIWNRALNSALKVPMEKHWN